MKKVRILAVVLAVITVATLALSFSANAAEPKWTVEEGTNKYTVDLGDKVNVLKDNVGLIYSISNVCDSIDIITDGVHFGYGKDPRVFYNKTVFGSKDAAKTAEEAPGTYEFKLADGKTNAYYYYIGWENVYANISSFDMYISAEDAYNTTGLHLPNYQIDAEFDILVSSDEGKTWNVAWQSQRLTFDPNSSAIVTGCAGFTENEGAGNAVEVKITDPANPENVLTTYRYIAGEFNKTYENVTNVAYAVSHIRRDGQTIDEKDAEGNLINRTYQPKAIPQYYACRISEFQAFGTKLEAPATEVTSGAVDTTAVPETTKKPEETQAPVTSAANADTTAAPETTEAPKSGCGSVAAIGVAMIVTVLGAAVIRKKN